MRIDPAEVHHSVFHGFLLSAVTPRPIAFASTVDASGQVNLSPFSFFNCFSANPPVLVFSPSRRGRDNTVKHTFENVGAVPEVVINLVNFELVEQSSLASTEYARGVNEFKKSGLTEIPSERVRPPRVKESPIAFECKVVQVIPLGEKPGSGNLVVCEILLMHIKEEVLNEAGHIDPYKLDIVARLGGDLYCRVNRDNIFKVARPNSKLGMGMDNLPRYIKESTLLTGNDLARLANIEEVPAPFTKDEIYEHKLDERTDEELTKIAQHEIRTGDVQKAWKILQLLSA